MSLPTGTVVAFHVDGVDGGDWQIARTAQGAQVSAVDQTPKDCEMWCSEEIFMRIVSGALRSSRAFLNGDLRIAGDVGLAMKCEILLREAA
jgi:putative sterol carrier protein